MSVETWNVVGFIVRGSLPLLCAAGIVRLLTHRSAALRHAIWTAGLLAALIAPLLTLVGIPTLARVPSLDVPRVAPLLERRPGADAEHDPWLTESGQSEKRRGHAGSDGDDAAGAPDPDAIILVVWLLGAATSVGRLVLSHLRASALAKRSNPATSDAVTRCWATVLASMPIRLRVDLHVGEVRSPATVGVFRHVVLIPSAAAEWDDAALRQVFEHELAHVRRRDGLIDLIAALTAAMHWYNPLVRRAVDAMAVERERACDDFVLTRGAVPRDYARLLLRNAAELRGSPARMPALAFAATSELESRLRAVLDDELPRHGMTRRAAFLCAAVAGVATLLVSAVRMEATAASPRRVRSQLQVGVRSTVDVDSSRRLPAGEPDLRGDSVAAPQSEQLTGAPPTEAPVARESASALDAALRDGPDAGLAATLLRSAIRLPTDEVDLVPRRATWALRMAREGRLIEPLVDALEDDDWRVQAHAAWALGVAGQAARRDSRAQPRLMRALDHPVWRVRAAAAFALREVGDSGATPALARALGDAAWQVRAPAVQFLAEFGDARSRSLLRPMLRDRHVLVRETAFAALTQARTTSSR